MSLHCPNLVLASVQLGAHFALFALHRPRTLATPVGIIHSFVSKTFTLAMQMNPGLFIAVALAYRPKYIKRAGRLMLGVETIDTACCTLPSLPPHVL